MICYRCFTYNNFDEIRPSKKVKNLNIESSKRLKMCKNCNCRVFYKLINNTITRREYIMKDLT